MGWTAAFQEALQDRTHAPMFFLEVSKLTGAPGATGETFFSHPEDRLPLANAISRDSIRLTSGSVSTLSWSKSFGGLSFGLHGGAAAATNLLQTLVRGSIVRLFVGFDGWDYADFEPVFTGQVNSLRGTPQRGYQVQCWDIVRALGTRWTTVSGQMPLFHALSSVGTTVNGGAYTPGDSTIEVASSATAYREAGGRYLLRVTPSSGADFYLVASSVAANVFTLVSPGSDWYGPPRATAAVGNTVIFQALLWDHPADIFRKLLISTGTPGAAHATWDAYPADWSFACPVDWVDVDDIGDAMTRASVDTAVNLDVIVTEEQLNPVDWFMGAMKDKGFFPVHRQGQISMRAATDPTAVASSFLITDMEIEQVLDWQAWDGSRQIEYQTFVARSASGGSSVTTGEGITTLPSTGQYLFNASHAWQGGTAWTADLTVRLPIWATRIPERVSLLLSGLAYAGLCEGDIGHLTSSHIPSRDPEGTRSRACMVLSCEPSWTEGTVRLDLAIPPSWSTEHKT